jgi:hypothetical protein
LSVLSSPKNNKTKQQVTQMNSPNNAVQPQDIAWNDKTILEAFQSNPRVVQDELRKLGLKVPTSTAVYQWVSRGRIPDRWRPTLIYVLMRDGKITVRDLFKRGLKK